MQNSIYKIKYLLFLSWDWEAWCLTQSGGGNTPSPERNTAWNKGRKCFHCLGAPNNLIRPCASHNNMFYVFCPVAHSAVTISWLHMMFLWWQRVLSAWPWPAIIKVPISPIRPELCNIIIIVIICNGLRNSPSLRISQSSWFTLAISRLPHVIAEHKNFLRLHAYRYLKLGLQRRRHI